MMILAALALIAAPQDNSKPAPDLGAAQQAQRMRQFTICAAQDRPRAAKLLGAVPGTAEENFALTDLLQNACPNFGDVVVDPALVRGMVAEALFHQNSGKAGSAATVRLFAIPNESDYAALPETARYGVALAMFADCVVAGAPGETRALLGSAAGTSSEAAAFSAISPALGPCLSNGATIKFNRRQLRGALAESAYRAAVVARGKAN